MVNCAIAKALRVLTKPDLSFRPGWLPIDAKLRENLVRNVVEDGPDFIRAFLPARQSREPRLGQTVDALEVVECDFRYVAEGWSSLHFVLVVEAVGEAELDVDTGDTDCGQRSAL